jgi:hypothetical protein
MEVGLLQELEKLELLGFFSGFPLLYLIFTFFADLANSIAWLKPQKIEVTLARAYNMVGLLYFGFVCKQVFLAADASAVFSSLLYLKVIGLLAAFAFLVPSHHRLMVVLLHSLCYFSLLAADLINYLSRSISDEVVHNALSMLGTSTLLHLTTIILTHCFLLASRYIKDGNKC